MSSNIENNKFYPVNLKRVVELPLNDFARFETENLRNDILLLRESIKGDSPSSVLLTGYKGVGKSSFVQTALSLIEDDLLVCSIQIPRFEGSGVLFRKIIRSIYLGSLQHKLPSETDDFLTVLYERTFHNVDITNDNLVENAYGYDAKFDVLKLALFIVVSAYSLSVLVFPGAAEVIVNVAPIRFIHFILFVFSSFMTLANILSIIRSKSLRRVNSKRILSTTFFDDEIAEHQTLEVLDKISKSDLKVVLVFDEIDKIDNGEELEALFKSLKTMLLSGKSYNIVVAGPILFKKLIRSYNRDDDFFASMFSRHFHVGVENVESFSNIYKEVFAQAPDSKVFYDLLLKSNFVLRRLVLEIRKHSVFFDDAFHYCYQESPLSDHFEKLVSSIQVIPKIVFSNPSKIERDVAVYSLCMWTNRIISKNGFRFSFNMIFDEAEFSSFPEEIKKSLELCCRELINDFCSWDVLDEIDSIDPDGEPFYKWNLLQGSKQDINANEVPVNEFLDRFFRFEKILTEVSSWLLGTNPEGSIERLVGLLGSRHPEWGELIQDSGMDRIFYIKNKITHEVELDNNEKSELVVFSSKVLSLERSIIHLALFEFFQRKFQSNFILTKSKETYAEAPVDIFCEPKVSFYKRVIFDIKILSQNINFRNVSSQIESQILSVGLDTVGVLLLVDLSTNEEKADLISPLESRNFQNQIFKVNVSSDSKILNFVGLEKIAAYIQEVSTRKT